MDPHLSEFINVLIIHLAGLISPGPNFALVVRNSLLFSRRHAFFTIAGLTAATTIQIFIVLVGLGVIICQSPNALKTIQFIGALFLGYLGLNGWGIHFSSQKTPEKKEEKADSVSLKKSVHLAFMTSLLNPMSLLFYMAVFTNEVSPQTSFSIRFLYLCIMVLTYAFWFVLVSLFFSHQKVQNKFLGLKDQIDKIIGTILIFFTFKFIYLALSH